jgi:wyosine [tRNA(Phe)-imidazoG37] synthetase (radical SAM superfamily)
LDRVTGSRTPLTYHDHSRSFESNRYVYAVLSRRARGISVGVNLNPDKICNFDCLYCQVDRRTPAEVRRVDEERLLGELREMLTVLKERGPEALPRLAGVPGPLRRVVDVAFSGDGEPTSHPRFLEVVEGAAGLLEELGLDGVRLTLITNASLLDRPRVKEALKVFDRCRGEIWAKLDAGTEEYYHRVCVTSVPFEKVLANIRDAGQTRPIVIQSLFMRLDGEAPGPGEVEAYAARLHELRERGCRLDRVQIYTVARAPADPRVEALDEEQIDQIARTVQGRCPGLCVETYAGLRASAEAEGPGA